MQIGRVFNAGWQSLQCIMPAPIVHKNRIIAEWQSGRVYSAELPDFPVCSVFRMYTKLLPPQGFLPVQSVVSFIRFSNRIGSVINHSSSRKGINELRRNSPVLNCYVAKSIRKKHTIGSWHWFWNKCSVETKERLNNLCFFWCACFLVDVVSVLLYFIENLRPSTCVERH